MLPGDVNLVSNCCIHSPVDPRPTHLPLSLRASTGDDGWTRWQRRAFTVPLLGLLTAVVTTLSPALLVLALLGDVLRPHRLVLCRTFVFFLFFLWAECVGLLCAAWLWLKSARVLGGNANAFVVGNRRLQVAWNRALFKGGSALYNLTLQVEGRECLASDGALLVLTRHVSTVDTVLPVTLLSEAGRNAFRFVLKRELLSDPCLDVVGNRLTNHFVRRGEMDNAEEIAGVKGLMRDLGGQDVVVVFPEGGRFSSERRARLLTRLEQSQRADTLALAQSLKHTLPPLTEGTLAMAEVNPNADLLIVAHTGLEAAAGFPDFIRGALVGATLRVKLWRIPYATLPHTREGLTAAFSETWKQVDAFIETHRPR